MSEKEKKERSFKIVLLGDNSVGKTCFIKRYIDNTFLDVHLSTIGLDYKHHYVTLKNGKKVKTQIWDTAGQERFRTVSTSYFKGAHGIMLIYDVTDKNTFANITKWISQIREEVSNKVCIILVANKIDIEEREVSEEDGINLAKEFNLKLFEASAKDNINVAEAYQELMEDIYQKFEYATKHGKELKKSNKNNKTKCCG